MEKKVRKLIYLFFSVLYFGLLFYFCIIKQISHSMLNFIAILVVAFLCMYNYVKYRLEKNSIILDDSYKTIENLSKEYLKEKKNVEYVSSLIYSSITEDNSKEIEVILNYDECYLLFFSYNLNSLSESKNTTIDELTDVQKAACLMDALCRKKAWVFEPICEDNYDILCETIYLNIELAIKVGLLLCGYTLEEFDNNPTLVASFGIVLDEVTLHEQDNNLVFIEILENFLKILNETNIDF